MAAQYSTGGKKKPLGIGKRGNRYPRKLLIDGARAVLQMMDMQSPVLRTWLTQLTSLAHSNVAAVVLANKLARIAWAALEKGEVYRLPLLASEELVCNLRPAKSQVWRSHSQSPQSQTSGYGRLPNNDFLPGVLANNEMAKRSNPALSIPGTRQSRPRPSNYKGRERCAFHQVPWRP